MRREKNLPDLALDILDICYGDDETAFEKLDPEELGDLFIEDIYGRDVPPKEIAQALVLLLEAECLSLHEGVFFYTAKGMATARERRSSYEVTGA